MEMGVIVARAFAASGEIVTSELPAGRAAHFLLEGPYDGLPGAWQTLLTWCTKEGLTRANTNWEIYRDNDDPAKTQSALYLLLA